MDYLITFQTTHNDCELSTKRRLTCNEDTLEDLMPNIDHQARWWAHRERGRVENFHGMEPGKDYTYRIIPVTEKKDIPPETVEL